MVLFSLKRKKNGNLVVNPHHTFDPLEETGSSHSHLNSLEIIHVYAIHMYVHTVHNCPIQHDVFNWILFTGQYI